MKLSRILELIGALFFLVSASLSTDFSSDYNTLIGLQMPTYGPFFIPLLFVFILFILLILVVIWVYFDAKRHGEIGIVWAIIVLCFPLVGFVLYLLIRDSKSSPFATNQSQNYYGQDQQSRGPIDKTTRFCHNCGAENASSAKFCSSCGESIARTS